MQLTGHIFSDIFVAFAAGVVVSLTPCVYPVLPLTAGFIAGFNPRGSRWVGFFLSLIYVLGMALTYSGLAIIAAWTGKLFGQLQNHPVLYIGVANVLILLALVMVDVIALPALSAGAQAASGRKSLMTLFLCGMTAGLVVGPCTAPVLGALLLHIAHRQMVVYGVVLTFVFAYGAGASLILVGTFAGLLGSLPRSGPWLLKVKQVCALILVIFAEVLLIKAGGLIG